MNLGLIGKPLGVRKSGPAAALSLAFTSGVLDSRITFTRPDLATCATSMGSDGRLVTWGRNELLWSEDFSNAVWGKGSVSVAASGFNLRGAKAFAVTTTSTTVSANYVSQSIGTVSGYRTVTLLLLASDTSSQAEFGLFDSTTPTWGLSGDSTGVILDGPGSITRNTGALFKVTGLSTTTPTRIQVTRNYTSSVAGAFYVYPDTSNSVTIGKTIHFAAPQLELGPTATAYSPTTTAANSAPRFDYDPATANGTTGPELWTGATTFSAGTVTASGTSVVFSGAAGLVSAAQSVASSNGKVYEVTYTVSNYVSGDVRLILYGNGTNYVGVTRNAAGTYTETYRLSATGGSFNNEIRVQTVSGATLTVSGITVKETQFQPRGLLIEESRTNLLIHNRDMTQAAWSKTDVTANRNQIGLDGVANTACLMTEGSAGTASCIQTATVTAGQTHTVSRVLKRGNVDWMRLAFATSSANGGQAWFNLNTGAKGVSTAIGAGTSVSSTITNLGGGWYRCTVTATVADASTSIDVNAHSASADASTTRVANATYIVDCAQLEVGAFATSIIITDASTKTRAADSASMTGANFSSWFNASAGTFVAEADQQQVVASQSSFIFSADDGTGANRIYSAYNGSVRLFQVDVASVSQCNSGTGVPLLNAVQKFAGAYAANDFATAFNGGAVSTDASGSLPTVNALRFGVSPSGVVASYLNGHIRRIAFYPVRLPNATLQALTA